MKRTKLLKTQPCEAPRISSEEDVICASQIVEADGEKALRFRCFTRASSEDGILRMKKTQCLDRWKVVHITAEKRDPGVHGCISFEK